MGEVLTKRENRIWTWIGTILALIIYGGITALLIYVIYNSGKWPAGDDVMYHIYRGEKVYEAIANGDLWPALDLQWYNGVELLRYWSPLAAYMMAFCQWICHGDSMQGYLVFTGAVYMISSVSWYIIGVRKNRPVLGFAIGAIWFLLPQNITYYFGAGNLAGMLGIACALPWMIFFLNQYVETPSRRSAAGLAVSTALMGLCHSGFALLCMLVMLILLLVRRIMDDRAKNAGGAIVLMVLGFLLTAVWFLASRTGVGSVNYTEQFAAAFQSLFDTLNPLDRSKTGYAHYYFGLSVFIIAIIGIFFSRKKSRPGFLVAVLICVLTSRTAYLLIKLLPGSNMLWTSRMINAALAIFLFSMLDWKSLRRPLQILMIAVIVIDSSISFGVIAGSQNGESLSTRFSDEQHGTLITEAKKITDQRIALIDGSSLGSLGAYLVSTWEGDTDASFGAGYEAAVTRKNITMLNRAAVDGCYDYLFDRSLELGNDTVLIQVNQLKNKGDDCEALDQAAEDVGYTLIDSNSEYRLYHLDSDGTFGTVTEYEGIAIGKNASDVAEYFPALKEADDVDVSNYTYSELSGYRVVYLDGFEASDKSRAEKLLTKLASNGVRIVIAADGIPDKLSGEGKTFLGVSTNPVKFENGYPKLNTKLGSLDTDLFPNGSENWYTVYLNGLDDVWGSVTENGSKLNFMGTAGNDNIVFIGLNLTYYYALTQNEPVGELLSLAMDVKSSDLPEREIVPMTIRAGTDSLRIETDRDNVNTGIAYHDIFTSNGKVWSEHNLTCVNKGETVITYNNKWLVYGLFVSLAAAIGLVWTIRREEKTERGSDQ